MTDNALKDTFDYIVYTLSVGLDPTFVKSVFAVLYIMVSFTFDVKQGSALLALFILIIIDFLTGVSATKYLGEPIRSSKIKHTAIKMTSYFAVIAGSHLAEYGLTKYLALIDETVLAFFLLTELISLLENMGRMGVQTPQKILNQLRDKKNEL